jgi:outer membrane protein assembly factor BamD (BamD/ComL family)/TM2 domain-containing membrane protein YozV
MKKYNLVAILFSILLVVCPATPSPAGEGIVITEELQLKLGDAFMEDREYYRAVTEYMKFSILFPGSSKGDYALFNIGMAYFRGDEYKKAAESFASVVDRYGVNSYAPVAAFYEGLSYARLEMYDLAGKAFDRVVQQYPSSEYAPAALMGKSLLMIGQQDISGSRRELKGFLASYPEDSRVTNVRDAIAQLDLTGDLPRKSPILAGIMSAVIPGSGHLYAGHYGDGITSLFLNGLFIAGTVVAVKQENYAVAGIAGLIGMPFYLGNIYGAANAATKWNLAVRRDLQGKIAVTLDYRF